MEQDARLSSNGHAAPRIETTSRRPRYWLHILLFVLTIGTTMMTGAELLGHWWLDVLNRPALLLHGAPYALALLMILTCHEMGHYLAARYHRMDVTLPFYIPLPLFGMFHLGTMGAFIRIRSQIPNRRALMDVAVAGPLAGFVVSLLFLAYGYLTIPDLPGIIAHVERIHPWNMEAPGGLTLTLGKSILFMFFHDGIGHGLIPMSEVYHFPFLFAGWAGLLVTAINLFPIGQLDGGHVMYSLLGPRARYVSRMTFATLALLTTYLLLSKGPVGMMWIPWMIILAVIGLRHPPTVDDHIQPGTMQKWLGWTCLAIFILCFMPLPIYF